MENTGLLPFLPNQFPDILLLVWLAVLKNLDYLGIAPADCAIISGIKTMGLNLNDGADIRMSFGATGWPQYDSITVGAGEPPQHCPFLRMLEWLYLGNCHVDCFLAEDVDGASWCAVLSLSTPETHDNSAD